MAMMSWSAAYEPDGPSWYHVPPLFVDEGFRADDPGYAVGVYVEALIRVTGWRWRYRARARWGSGYTLRRFHEALLAGGAPPLGMLDDAVVAG